MVKLRKFPFLFVLIALVFTKGVYAQEIIKSASEYDYPPFSIVTEKGEADGFSVELLRASLKAVGLNVKFYVAPWAKIKQDLAQGKIQVLPLVGRTPERENIYDFSVPYKTDYGGIFVRTDETSINTLKDLEDKEVLVMKGDNAEEFLLRENVSKHIITTESFKDAFKKLSEGKHDAVVVQQTVGAQLIGKLGITNVIHKSRIDKYKQDWTFAVKEGDNELLANLNDGLSKIIINGTFDKIHDKWFKRPNVDEKIKIKLTPKEKAFIDEHPEITIAHTFDWPPYSFLDRNGKPVGPSIEFFELVAQMAGFKFTVHQDGLWNRIYEAGKNKQVDVVASMTITKKREQWFSFPRPYLFLSSYIITRKDFQEIKHRDDLKGKKLSGAKGTWQNDDVLKNYPSVKIDYVDTYSEALMDVSAGKADATVMTLGSALYDISQKGIYNLNLAAIYEKDTDLISFGVRKDWPELVSIIDKALAAIPEATKVKIIHKWMPPLESQALSKPALTKEEKAWLLEKHIIRVHSSNYPPYIILKEGGDLEGIAIDYLKLIAERTGIKFEYHFSDRTITEALDGIKKHQGPDLFSIITRTPERERSILFSKDYLKSSYAIFTRADKKTIIVNIDDLINKKIALARGTVLHQKVKKDYPDIKLMLFDTDILAIKAVANDKADAYIGNLTVGSYLILEDRLYNMKVASPSPFGEHYFSIGSRNDWPELASIINKGLDSITPDEQQSIRNKYITLRYEQVDVRIIIKWILSIAAIASIIVFWFIFWNRRLSREIHERKKVEQEREKLIFDLQKAAKEVKQLSGLLPICASCKKIRDDKGYWNQIEGYIQNHSEAQFSHGMCPECSDELYGKEDWYIEMKNEEKQKK